MRWSPLIWGTGVLLFVQMGGALALRGLNRAPAPPRWEVPGGDAKQGKAAIAKYGCGSCHTIPGVDGANARVGPLLADYRKQGFIAGRLPNVPHELVRWIQHPQEYLPGGTMPELGVTETDARNIAAYLYKAR